MFTALSASLWLPCLFFSMAAASTKQRVTRSMRKRQVPAFGGAGRLCKRKAAPAAEGMRAVKKALKPMKRSSTAYKLGDRVGVKGVSGSRKNWIRIKWTNNLRPCIGRYFVVQQTGKNELTVFLEALSIRRE